VSVPRPSRRSSGLCPPRRPSTRPHGCGIVRRSAITSLTYLDPSPRRPGGPPWPDRPGPGVPSR
jgi:hypothetical protein